ncbi:5064_t:CDS:1, partial [Dentiscutata erythropus]
KEAPYWITLTTLEWTTPTTRSQSKRLKILILKKKKKQIYFETKSKCKKPKNYTMAIKLDDSNNETPE